LTACILKFAQRARCQTELPRVLNKVLSHLIAHKLSMVYMLLYESNNKRKTENHSLLD